jgi:methionine aminopeptidase
MVKLRSDLEIEKIRESAALVAEVLGMLRQWTQPGASPPGISTAGRRNSSGTTG